MGRIHGGTQSSDMKTILLLLSVSGLALVCAELQHGEDQHTEDANVVAVDDSAAAMDDATDKKDDSRRTGYESWTKTSTASSAFLVNSMQTSEYHKRTGSKVPTMRLGM